MQERYEDETDDHEEEPCGDFFYPDHMPCDRLGRVYPYFCIRGDVLCYPYDESDEEKSESQIHRVVFLIWSEVYLCPSESDEDTSDDHIAKIPDKMM